MKCANCPADALFEYRITLDKSVYYCGKHLPKFLEPRRKAGQLTLTPAFEEAKKQVDELVGTPVAVVQEPAADPEPKKKRTKKAAVKDADNS